MAQPDHLRSKTISLNLLLEKAGIQGYLTTEDLMKAYPEVQQDAEMLSRLLLALQRKGVDILDEHVEEPDLIDDEESNDGDSYPLVPDEGLASDDIVGIYLKEMSRVPLLTVEEELEIAMRIEKGRQAKQTCLKANGRSAAALRRKLEPIVEDGQRAREHLIKANTRLVVSIAKRYMGRGVRFLDLIQEGNLGLMKAVEKYDYTKGFRFSTYATWWIRQTITRAIADQSRTIRVPVHMSDRIRTLYRANHELEQKLGRTPTIEELAKEVRLDVQKVQWIMKVSWLPLSLESPVGDEDDSELGMFIEDKHSPTPMQSAYQSMLKEKLEEVLSTLPAREARVLRMRFGLDDGMAYTLEEVGQKFGLTRERIRQIEGKALRRMRHPRRSRQLKDYL